MTIEVPNLLALTSALRQNVLPSICLNLGLNTINPNDGDATLTACHALDLDKEKMLSVSGKHKNVKKNMKNDEKTYTKTTILTEKRKCQKPSF